MTAPSVFISYSHKDEELKDQLRPHLAVVEHQGRLSYWEDRQIAGGADWFEAISQQLQQCRVAILLITADFLNSKFCMQEEVPPLLERRRREGLLIVPLLMRPCAWQRVAWLKAIQMLPRDGMSAAQLTRMERDKLFTDIARATANYLELFEQIDISGSTL